MTEENRIVCVQFIDNGSNDEHTEWINMAFLKASADPVCQQGYAFFAKVLSHGERSYEGLPLGEISHQLFEDWLYKRTDRRADMKLPCLVTDHIQVFYN